MNSRLTGTSWRPRVGYLSAGLRASTRSDSREGGPRTHMLGVINGFEHLGWPVERFIVGDRLNAAAKYESGGHSGGSRLKGVAADVGRIGIGSVNARRALRQLGGRVDLVYERAAPMQSLGQQFQRRGIPWVLESNSIHFLEAKGDRQSLALPWLSQRQEVWSYNRCDVLVCVTEVLKDMIVRATGVPERKVVVIPNGVDAERFDPARFPSERNDDRLVVGFVGSLYPWQGIDHLIQAIASLPDDVGVDAMVVGDGPARLEWEALARSAGVAHRVRFAGRANWDDVPGHIASFDVTFSGHQPGRSDPRVYFSPLKIYEYLAMAKPVIASATEDAARLLSSEDVGYLYPVGEVEGLRAALIAAWNERSRLPERGERARALVLREHTWDARVRLMASKLVPLLAERYPRFRDLATTL